MLSAFSPARRQSKLVNTKSRLLWLSRCSLLVCCQVVSGSSLAPGPKPEPRPLQSAMPPADNSTGFCACTLYLVFKEPTRTGPESRSRWPSPFLTVFRGTF